MKPFLKWAGGKQRLLPQLLPLFPKTYDRYLEPFLGGGAVFFELQPKVALLADANRKLIECYRAVKKSPALIEAYLLILQVQHSEDPKKVYQGTREAFNVEAQTSEWGAAQFIYLNKACFNGLYRVNKRGEFNTPRGTSLKVYVPLQDTARVLQTARLLVSGYRQTLGLAKEGDFVYLDPPYPGTFQGYTPNIFGRSDHNWLACFMHNTKSKVALSLPDTVEVRELYSDLSFHTVTAPRTISRDGSNRTNVGELLICNYDAP